MKKLENYKVKDDLLTAVAEADAMIIRSDIVDQAVPLQQADNFLEEIDMLSGPVRLHAPFEYSGIK